MSKFLNDIRKGITAGFKGKFDDGLLRVEAVDSIDSEGDGNAASWLEYTFEGYVESYSDFVRTQAGIPVTDVKLYILADTLEIKPPIDALVNLPAGTNSWFTIKTIDRDPATAMWFCRLAVIRPPGTLPA